MIKRLSRYLAERIYVWLGFCSEDFGCLGLCTRYGNNKLFYLKLKYFIFGYIAGTIIFLSLLMLLQK